MIDVSKLGLVHGILAVLNGIFIKLQNNKDETKLIEIVLMTSIRVNVLANSLLIPN